MELKERSYARSARTSPIIKAVQNSRNNSYIASYLLIYGRPRKFVQAVSKH